MEESWLIEGEGGVKESDRGCGGGRRHSGGELAGHHSDSEVAVVRRRKKYIVRVVFDIFLSII